MVKWLSKNALFACIATYCEETQAGGTTARHTVNDTPEQLRCHITAFFPPRSQATSSQTQHDGGTGIRRFCYHVHLLSNHMVRRTQGLSVRHTDRSLTSRKIDTHSIDPFHSGHCDVS